MKWKRYGKIWNQVEALSPIISPFLPLPTTIPPLHQHTRTHTHLSGIDRSCQTGTGGGGRDRGAVSIGCNSQDSGTDQSQNSETQLPLLRWESSIRNNLGTLYTTRQQLLELDVWKWTPISSSQSTTCGSSRKTNSYSLSSILIW